MSKIKVKPTDPEFEAFTLESILKTLFFNMAVKIFEWSNLPEGVECELIEKFLYETGQLLFINDSELGYLTLPAYPDTKINVYGRSNKYRAVGVGYNKSFTINDWYTPTGLVRKPNAVLVRNNASSYASKNVVDFYVTKLTDLEGAIKVNVNATKTGVVFSGNETEMLTFKNIYKKIVGNEGVVYLDKMLGENPFKAWNTQTQFYADKYLQLYKEYENKILTFLGIKTNPETKKERLLVDEVNRNNENINANVEAMLEEREKAVKKINKLFGLNIKVQLNKKIFEEEQDEQVYNGTENDNSDN